MFETLAPPNPLIVLFVCTGFPTKSSILLEMHAEHLLSMPTCSPSVSNMIVLCCFILELPVWPAIIATTGYAITSFLRWLLPLGYSLHGVLIRCAICFRMFTFRLVLIISDLSMTHLYILFALLFNQHLILYAYPRFLLDIYWLLVSSWGFIP